MSTNAFNLAMSKILSFGKGLYKTKDWCHLLNFRGNALQNHKILDQSKFEAFTGNKIHKWEGGVLQIIGFVFDRIENIVEKRENVGYQHFFLISAMFFKAFFRVVKTRHCVVKS